jgi:cytidylate kinase
MSLNNFNIAIDGLSATGKTTLGQKFARQFNFKFIDSGRFYRYYAKYYENVDNDDLALFLDFFIDNPDPLTILNTFDENDDQEKKLLIGNKASLFSKNEALRDTINTIIQKMVVGKRYVVVGRDATTKILPDAEVKILLNSDLETRIQRRSQQTNLDPLVVLSDLLERDKESFKLIQEASKVSTMIDTTHLDIEQTIRKLLFVSFLQLIQANSNYYLFYCLVFFLVLFCKLYL